jgi:hypothetical protein
MYYTAVSPGVEEEKLLVGVRARQILQCAFGRSSR